MEGMWRKAKKALGVGICVHLPAIADDREDGASDRRVSDAFSQDSAAHASAPNTPAQVEVGALQRSKSGAKSSKGNLACERYGPICGSSGLQFGRQRTQQEEISAARRVKTLSAAPAVAGFIWYILG